MSPNNDILEEYIFEGIDDFHAWISVGDAWMISEPLTMFHEAYMHINKGCGCGKKKRWKKVEIFYKELPTLMSPDTALDLRRSARAKKIIFKLDGKAVGSF